MPHKSSVPLYWRLQKSRYTLTGTRCKTCNTAYFPPRDFCSSCRRKGEIENFRFSGMGRIVSYTTIRIPPEGFEKYTPYAVAIIELEEGTRISGQVIGNPDEVRVGNRVRPVFRRMYEDSTDGLIQYGIKFEIDVNQEPVANQ
jgi:uncharacterized OB-fold protein